MYRKGVTAKQIEHKTVMQKFLHIAAIYMLVFTRMDYSSTLVEYLQKVPCVISYLHTLCTQLFTLTIYKMSFHKKKQNKITGLMCNGGGLFT